ncbi:ankyrin repeat-containing protein c [Lichtheimia corymbifera JMRC:FSU:9682]|uniref:Ankyrin repeat-containing protein c n=1 Tax=Lichtheimia corymbifera JMRC:FSU:9682 TaxID=1263082 RepID=A0A068S409_9FUNG|nr:ankyrin repeat-containing protein c [Lichtheimia corymbifera JMRC:FSU:9682]
MATNNELLDDVIFAARSGDLDDLKNANPIADYFVTKNDMGNTALHMASANGHEEVVAWMVEKLAESKGDQLKAAVNVQNEEGNTPLHWGALNGHLAVVEILVKNGADCKIKNKMGKTPIYEAQQRTHEKVAEFFLATMIDEEPDEPVDEDEQFVENGYQKQ